VLVKSWLLAIPHLIIVGIIAGGAWFGWTAGEDRIGGGLITILVIVAGVMLLFTKRYPRSLFDFIMGLNRWVARVCAYVTLMTDKYPPFRLDQGGEEPPPPAEAVTPAVPAGF
jgi:Domain of unknown function (DUF4389)